METSEKPAKKSVFWGFMELVEGIACIIAGIVVSYYMLKELGTTLPGSFPFLKLCIVLCVGAALEFGFTRIIKLLK